MQYILMDYVQHSGWQQLTREEQEHWLGSYRGFMEAMKTAGILKGGAGLYPSTSAATVRVQQGQMQVMDGPYADTREQLGGFHLIEVPDLDAAIAWAARSPTALHGVVEVRAVREGSMVTRDIAEFLDSL
ncbi:MAG: YciI family protein [Terracidiphilus sp.]